MIEASATRRPATPRHREVGVDHAARIFARGHAAGAGGVLDVAGDVEHQRVQLGRGQSGGGGQAEAGVAEA